MSGGLGPGLKEMAPSTAPWWIRAEFALLMGEHDTNKAYSKPQELFSGVWGDDLEVPALTALVDKPGYSTQVGQLTACDFSSRSFHAPFWHSRAPGHMCAYTYV